MRTLASSVLSRRLTPIPKTIPYESAAANAAKMQTSPAVLSEAAATNAARARARVKRSSASSARAREPGGAGACWPGQHATTA